MIALSVHKVTKSFPLGLVFENINWEIQLGRKIGFLGINGVGKTTLLRVMAGDLEADSGAVTRARGIRVGRLRQIPDRRLQESLFDYTAGGRTDLISAKRKIDELSARLAESPENHRLAESMGEAQHEYEIGGGFDLEYRTGVILTGLGFEKKDYAKSLDRFSGGERTRAELARILMADDEVILLDEPTNHLDLAAIEWLEEFIIKSPKAVVFVTHDRLFLDTNAKSRKLPALRISSPAISPARKPSKPNHAEKCWAKWSGRKNQPASRTKCGSTSNPGFPATGMCSRS